MARVLRLSVLYSSLHAVQAWVNPLSPISIYGTKFFYENGSQHFIKGTVYGQYANATIDIDVDNSAIAAAWPVFDAFTDATQCQRDADLMAQLGVNTIKLEKLNSSMNHSDCVRAFADKGIYMFVNLNADTLDTLGVMNPGVLIEANSVYTWDTAVFNQYTKIIDEFASYPSTTGFFVHWYNKWTYEPSDGALQKARAAISDVKTYIQQKSYRAVPIGIENDLPVGWNYFHCVETGYGACPTLDFMGIISNMADIEEGEAMIVKLENYTVPIFYSSITPRIPAVDPWAYVTTIYNDPATGSGLGSGAICGWWWVSPGLNKDANQQSLVSYPANDLIDPGNTTSVVSSLGTTATFTFDYLSPVGTPIAGTLYSSLSNQWKSLLLNSTEACSYTPSHIPPNCSVVVIPSVTLASYVTSYTLTTSTNIMTMTSALAPSGAVTFQSTVYYTSVEQSSVSSFLLDFTVPMPTTLPTLLTPTLTSTTAHSYQTSCTPKPSGSLSTATIAGIVVGSLAALALITTAAICLFRRHRRSLDSQLPEFVSTAPSTTEPHKTDSSTVHTSEWKAELDTSELTHDPKKAYIAEGEEGFDRVKEQAHELPVDPVELDAGEGQRCELDEQHGVSETPGGGVSEDRVHTWIVGVSPGEDELHL